MTISYDDVQDLKVANVTMLDFRDGLGFVGALTDRDGRELVAIQIGGGLNSIAILDQIDVGKLQEALAYAVEAHGGKPMLGLMSW